MAYVETTKAPNTYQLRGDAAAAIGYFSIFSRGYLRLTVGEVRAASLIRRNKFTKTPKCLFEGARFTRSEFFNLADSHAQ